MDDYSCGVELWQSVQMKLLQLAVCLNNPWKRTRKGVTCQCGDEESQTWVSDYSEKDPGVLYGILVRACSAEDCQKNLASDPRSRGKNCSLDIIGYAPVIESVDKPMQLILHQICEPRPSLPRSLLTSAFRYFILSPGEHHVQMGRDVFSFWVWYAR